MAENSPPSRLDDGSTSKKPVSLLENRPGRKKTDSIDLHEISGLGAQLGGITQQAISKMERGGEVSGSQLLELSRILNVPVSYFFDGLESGLGEALDDATAEGYTASGMMRGARYG